MNPLLYAIIGLLVGVEMAALIFVLARRHRAGESELAKRLEMFDRAQEREEKMFGDEFSRNRGGSAGSA